MRRPSLPQYGGAIAGIFIKHPVIFSLSKENEYYRERRNNMETVSTIYKKVFHIDLRDIDFTKKLKLSALFSYFQETASEAAEHLGAGIDILREQFGVAWVLTRVRVEIGRIPRFDEKIAIETWPLEPGKVEFERDFIVKDANGEAIINAVSKWVIMDINTRRLKRSDLIGLRYPEKITQRAIPGKLARLAPFGQPEEVYTKVIGYSDIDFNCHLNNSKYVDYMMDCFPVEEHRARSIQSIDIQFHNEALPGDSITLYKDIAGADNNFIYIEGKRKTDNKDIFKSVLQFKKPFPEG